jgi:muramoyltetrapeptide carboxypeptidase
MNRIIPPYLKNGDKLAIVATARWISEEHLNAATGLFASWGWEVVPGKHLHHKHFQLAGTDAQRAEDLQRAINDPEIKAIVIARGGYGTVRILDLVDFSPLIEHPKWICGYSDITVLHMKLRAMGLASIHSTMPVSFGDATSEALVNLRSALQGDLKMIEFAVPAGTGLQEGSAVGQLAGGNLSVLYSMLGSAEMQQRDDFILFIEDVDEMLYHLDRMMMGLKRSGFFRHVKAICMGGFTQMKDNTPAYGFQVENPWGFDAFQTVRAIADLYGIPLFTGFPAGHLSDNRAFYLGMPARLEMSSGMQRMWFQHPDREK